MVNRPTKNTPPAGQSTRTSDGRYESGEGCDTLLHYANVKVDPADVYFNPPYSSPSRWEGEVPTISFKYTADLYVECKAVECTSECTTSTESPISVEFYMETFPPTDFEAALDKHRNPDNGGHGGRMGLDELLEDGFVNADYAPDPENAYTWFQPVMDAIDYGKRSAMTGGFGDGIPPKPGGGTPNYLRPKGEDSISMREFLEHNSSDDWSRKFPDVKACQCTRVLPPPRYDVQFSHWGYHE